MSLNELSVRTPVEVQLLYNPLPVYRKVKVAHTRLQIPVLGSQHAGDMSQKPGGRLPLLSARPAVTLTTLKMASTSFAAW